MCLLDRQTFLLIQVPGHRRRSLLCPACGPERAGEEVQWAQQVFPDDLFVTVVPDLSLASRLTDRLDDRARRGIEVGSRLVVRREERWVWFFTTVPTTKVKGRDPFPSRPATHDEALRVLRSEALALPGMAKNSALVWFGEWARLRQKVDTEPGRYTGVHGTVAEAVDLLSRMAAEIGVEVEFSNGDQLVQVKADPASRRALLAALDNGGPDSWFTDGWEDGAEFGQPFSPPERPFLTTDSGGEFVLPNTSLTTAEIALGATVAGQKWETLTLKEVAP